MTPVLLVVALGAILAAVAFFMQSKTARAEATARAAEVDGARAEAAAAQKALADQKAELKERRDEAGALRQKLEEAKKKAFEQAEAMKKAGGAQALREELDKVASRLAEARAEAAHQVELARAAEAARVKAVAEAERLKGALDRELAKPPPVAPVAPPAPVPPDVAEERAKTAAAAEKAKSLDELRPMMQKDAADMIGKMPKEMHAPSNESSSASMSCASPTARRTRLPRPACSTLSSPLASMRSERARRLASSSPEPGTSSLR